MEDFSYQIRVSVRFRDTDALGMTHHAVILSYLEEARTAYLTELLDLDGLEEIGYTIAHVDCDYRAPTSYSDELAVGVRVTDIGDHSFEMEYRVERAESGDLVAEASTVQVQYDYDRGQSEPLPEDFERRVRSFESRNSETTEPTELP